MSLAPADAIPFSSGSLELVFALVVLPPPVDPEPVVPDIEPPAGGALADEELDELGGTALPLVVLPLDEPLLPAPALPGAEPICVLGDCVLGDVAGLEPVVPPEMLGLVAGLPAIDPLAPLRPLMLPPAPTDELPEPTELPAPTDEPPPALVLELAPPGDAAGACAPACASRLHASKSVCFGSAANAVGETITTPATVKSAVARMNAFIELNLHAAT